MFSPIVVTSTNVMNDLLEMANRWGKPIEQLDFDLISSQTFYKGIVDDEWQVLQNGSLLEHSTESEIRSEIFQIYQEHQIRIREYKPHPYMDLKFTLAMDKYKSKTVVIIDPSSLIPLKKGVQEWIKEAIYQKQLRLGQLIGLFDTNLEREINRLLLFIQKEGSLKEPYRLLVGEFFPPEQPTNDNVILHFQSDKESRRFIEGVKPDDLILEYRFAKHGRDGRGCDGKFIKVPEPTVKYAKYILINEETIRAEEDSESIRFYAKTSGFVERKKGIFTISKELRIDSAEFKKTGSIETGADKDVHLKIKQNISSRDSVGTGVTIDVQKLDISGTVGAHATIQACELTIGAQTHKKASIDVLERATIHLHRGNLKAKEAHINILETGKVEADTVHVKKMVGGEIIAREVHIDVLYSNAKIIALELISIQSIEGEGNNLLIHPDAIESYHEKITHLKQEIKEKTSRLQMQNKEFVTRQLSFKEKNSRVKQIQDRVIATQKMGGEPMKADLVRLQQYKQESNDLKLFLTKIQEDETHLHTLKEELERLFEADLHGQILHNGFYNGKNRVIFIDPKTKQEYAITPEGKVGKITLMQMGEEKKISLEE